MYAYDGHGRLASVTDARNGATFFGYNDADQIISVTTPAPGNGQPAQTTGTAYDHRGRPKTITLPDQTSVVNVYWPSGELKQTSGSRTFPVGYQYDAQGRMTFMTNWTSFGSAGQRVTAWTYHPQRGWLASKRYPDANGNPGAVGTDFTYYPSGKLHQRIWARESYSGSGVRLVTTYTVNPLGDFFFIDYNDNGATPTVSYGRDRLGRLTSVTRSGITTALTYNDADQQTSESYSGGVLNGLAVSMGYDGYLRRSTLGLNTSPGVSQTFGYDSESGRLQTVSDGLGNQAVYSYLANSPLVSHIEFRQSSTTRMTTTKQYDKANRLTSVVSAPSASAAVSFAYQYNAANQRYRVNLADGSYWFYEYDRLGQLCSGKRYWADGTPVAGQQFEYAHDDIGNRTSTKAGGDERGANLRPANYVVNSLNEYTSRDVPGAADILGVAMPQTTVTVNSQATYRRGEYFDLALGINNASSAVYADVTVTGTYGGNTDTATGKVFQPPVAESFQYDLDGNLTQDGRWNYVWDGENRLVAMNCRIAGPPTQHLTFEYDWQGRRIRKLVKDGSNNVLTDLRFVYDGWKLLAALNASSSVIQSFLWGLDAQSGGTTFGALLEVADAQNGVQFVAYDGHGNVVALIKAADGTGSTRYEYGPFGEIVRMTGPLGGATAFRWATKCWDVESDLICHGARYYDPSAGRFLGRDRREQGGPNPFAYVENDPNIKHDVSGQFTLLTLPVIQPKIPSSLLEAIRQRIIEGMLSPALVKAKVHKCGPDVTAALDESLTNVRAAFTGWSPSQKNDACKALRAVVGSWLIIELAELGYAKGYQASLDYFNERFPGATPGYDPKSLTYRGHCYSASGLQYMLWGLINRLCYDYTGSSVYSLDLTLRWTRAYKEWNTLQRQVTGGEGPFAGSPTETFQYLSEALQFTTAGFNFGMDPTQFLNHSPVYGDLLAPSEQALPGSFFPALWSPNLWPPNLPPPVSVSDYVRDAVQDMITNIVRRRP